MEGQLLSVGSTSLCHGPPDCSVCCQYLRVLHFARLSWAATSPFPLNNAQNILLHKSWEEVDPWLNHLTRFIQDKDF